MKAILLGILMLCCADVSATAARREALREGIENFRQMSPEQKQQMRRSLRSVRNLPPEEKQRLREQWRSLTPEQRRVWLKAGGPGIAPPP